MIQESMRIEKKKMSDLKPADYNPREIREESLAGLKGSIAKFGMIVPIIWNETTGNIVGGHQRYKILLEEGVKETDVVVVNLSDHEEVALNITMNNPSTRGVFTKSVVDLLESTKTHMTDGFEETGLADMLNYLGKYKFSKTSKPKDDVRDKEGNGIKKEGLRCPKCLSVWNNTTGEVISRSGVCDV